MIKHIFASIKKNKFISIIFIFQIVISVIGLSQISYYNDYLNIYNRNVKTLNLPKDNMYTTKYSGGFFEYESNNRFIMDLEKSLGKDSIGISQNTKLYINKFKNLNAYNNKLNEINPYLISEYENDILDNFKISQSMFELMNLNIVDGKNFTSLDFENINDKVRPILVSEEFKNVFKVGDIFEAQIFENYLENFEVIGFFDKNSIWFTDDFIHADLKNLNSSFISIFDYKKDNPHISNIFSSLYLFNNTNMNDSEFKNIVRNIANQNNITVYTKSVTDILNEKASENKSEVISVSLIGSILIIFTLFSIGLVSFYSLKYRKSEIGLLKVVGASTRKIKTIIISEWIIYMILSLIISFGITINNNISNSSFLKENIASVTSLATISYESVLFIWLILFILILTVVYISISKIIDKQVTELIKC